jgi:membrane protein DedA with SNARE-associated domain
MTLNTLLLAFGLPLVFFGTMLEGEAVVLAAGFLAQQGYLPVPGVIVAATLGTIIADQFFFMLGRKQGQKLFTKRPSWQANIERVTPWLKKYGAGLILVFRFVYGFRTFIAIALGISPFSAWRYLLLNSAGAVIWAALFTMLGYLFGNAIEPFLADARRYELWIAGGVVLAGTLLWLYRRKKRPDAPLVE